MVLIWGVAAVAAAARYFYNKAQHEHPAEADTAVKSMRQATSVLGALVSAVVAVLDALQLLTRPAGMAVAGGNGGATKISPPFGRNAGGEE